MTVYAQGETVLLFVTFATSKGEAATISGTPTISIYHRWGGSTTTDVNAQNLTQLTATTYYYSFYVNTSADKTDYVVKYAATYTDGTSAIGEDIFKVVDGKFYKKPLAGSSQTTIVRPIWTAEEKEKLIKTMRMIETLTKNLAEVTKLLTKANAEIAKSVEKVSSKLVDSDIKIENLKNEINEDTKESSIKYDKITKEVAGVTNLQSIKFSEIEKANSEATQKIQKIQSDIDELAKLVIKSLPAERLKEITNGN